MLFEKQPLSMALSKKKKQPDQDMFNNSKVFENFVKVLITLRSCFTNNFKPIPKRYLDYIRNEFSLVNPYNFSQV